MGLKRPLDPGILVQPATGIWRLGSRLFGIFDTTPRVEQYGLVACPSGIEPGGAWPPTHCALLYRHHFQGDALLSGAKFHSNAVWIRHPHPSIDVKPPWVSLWLLKQDRRPVAFVFHRAVEEVHATELAGHGGTEQVKPDRNPHLYTCGSGPPGARYDL